VWFNHWAVVCLAPVAVWILLNGLDDLFIDVAFLFLRKPLTWPRDAELAQPGQRRIAILVPLWHEHQVIGEMLQHNLAAILYGNYDFFVGVYPNDALTLQAVDRIARGDARVHLAVCSHDGPTSKGDCLNSAYDAMAQYEQRHGLEFEIVVIHDAEDLVHPQALQLINWFSREYQMVQVPVLPLATGLGEWTHGVYCDEFAEFQLKDIPVRQALGGFLPSNGVGTGFERSALERLRAQNHGLIFDPDCLTEDYETGLRMFMAGYRQIFVPVRLEKSGPVATREYFPRRGRAAIRQRSRWVAGIALQGWERHGWSSTARQRYWFWRDRKGLAANLIAPLAGLLSVFWICSVLAGYGLGPRLPVVHVPAWLIAVYFITTGISVLEAGIRVHLSARLYGAGFAAAAPLRILWANLINCLATLEALELFVKARVERRSPAWRKTEHVYPREADLECAFESESTYSAAAGD
jgi:bacteriophage N4 adsorption protein B